MSRQRIVVCMLLSSLSLGCAGPRFKRTSASPYTKSVCAEVVEQLYDQSYFTGITQVVVSEDRDVCTSALVGKLRREGVAVVAPSAVEGASNPVVSLYADSMGQGLFVTRLAIRDGKETRLFSQLYEITSPKRHPNRVTVASLGVQAMGRY